MRIQRLIQRAVVTGWAFLSLGGPVLGQSGAPPESGTLLSVQPGDTACYVNIRDPSGRRASWMAEFDLCDRAAAMIGRRFTLIWQAGTVQHPSCQGDPNCRRTQRVTLLSAMRPMSR